MLSDGIRRGGEGIPLLGCRSGNEEVGGTKLDEEIFKRALPASVRYDAACVVIPTDDNTPGA